METRDWFESALAENAELVQQFNRSQRSAEWSQGKGTQETQESFFERALRAARNVTRHQGVPARTEIRLARMNELGAGAAGFVDAPTSFHKPFILLDRSPYLRCRSNSVALDVYCGIALHEAGHILYTRDGYRRRAQSGRDSLLNSFDNLLEDDRIESLICRESPGYAPYIIAARKVVLEQGDFGLTLQEWTSLPDLEKVTALIMAFVRVPHLITAEAQSWQAINGEVVFGTLRKNLTDRPTTEADVASISEWLYHFYQRLKSLYSESNADRHCVSDAAERLAAQIQADAADARLRQALEEMSAEPEGIRKPLERGAASAKATQRRRNRFAPSDLHATVTAQASINQAFPDSLADAVEASQQAITQASLVREENWSWNQSTRSVFVIRCGDPDSLARSRYDSSRERVKPLVPAMKAALPQNGRVRKETLRDRTHGTIDARRIALAPVTNRIFKQTQSTERAGYSLGLLLDASGSMRSKIDVTRDAAVLLAEAFHADPRVTFGVYTHTSADENPEDCFMQILFDPTQRSRASIGAYSACASNYDHCAIAQSAELVRNMARRGDRRILIVISDGRPEGFGYGGDSAVAATRDAVNLARSSGTHVLAIGIGGYRCNEIYGDRWVLNLQDCKTLPHQLRAMLIRTLRGI